MNEIGQRVGLTPTGSAFADNTPLTWGYNHRGELTKATRAGSTAFDRSYSFDSIGNRLSSTDQNAEVTSYFDDPAGVGAGGNALYQYARITYPALSLSSLSTITRSQENSNHTFPGK